MVELEFYVLYNVHLGSLLLRNVTIIHYDLIVDAEFYKFIFGL